MRLAVERVELTAREEQVCRLVGQDRRYHEIAESLGISLETLRTHISQAASKIPGEGRARYKLLVYYHTRLLDN